jgi:hypothetical protein
MQISQPTPINSTHENKMVQVEMLQYENQRADRFMTWNLATERFSIVRIYVFMCVYGWIVRIDIHPHQYAPNHQTPTPKHPQRSLNTQDHPYIVATAETGYEDLPLVQRLVPECDGLEAKIEYLVREILAYCIRWYVGWFLRLCVYKYMCRRSVIPTPID